MTQTLQQALLKAGLVSENKLKKAESDKKAAIRAERQRDRQELSPPPKPGAKHAPKTHVRSHQPAPKKSVGFVEGKHIHHIRTDCEACGRSSPDVEYYEHPNRSLEKNWLCVRCADTHSIHDNYRQTMQSSHAMSGMFQRQYGPTKIFKRA